MKMSSVDSGQAPASRSRAVRVRTRKSAAGPHERLTARVTTGQRRLAFDETNFPRTRSFGGFLLRELDPLPLTEQFEHGTTDGAAVKEVFDSALIADESESLVDEEPCNRPAWHTVVLRSTTPPRQFPGLTRPFVVGTTGREVRGP